MAGLLTRARRFRRHGTVFLLAVLAYLPAFWWGAPHATAEDRRKAWGVDDEPPLGPLAQLHDMMTPGLAPDANLGYPMLHSYLVLGAYAPYLGFAVATGRLSSPSGEYPYGFADPVGALRDLSVIAHGLSVLLAAGIVLAAFVIGRTLWGERDGLWAAAAALLSFPMFYYSRTSNVDVPVLFFVASSLAVFAQLLARGVSMKGLALFSALAGLAVATKEPVAAAYLWVPFFLATPMGPWKGVRDPGRFLAGLGVAATSAFVAYAVGSGMLIDFTRWKAHIDFAVMRTTEVSQGDVSFVTPNPWTLSGHIAMLGEIGGRLRDALTLPGLLLSVVGVGLVFRRAERRGAWLVMAAVTYLLVLFVAVRIAHLRYVMPAMFVLAIMAGHAVARLMASSRVVVRGAAALTATAMVVVASLQAIELTSEMLRDSRYAAGEWIATVAHPGDRLEYFGAFQKNPPLPAYVESGLAVEYLGGTVAAPRDDATADRIRAGWSQRKPRFIVLSPDHTSRPGEPYAHTVPPVIYDDLESGRLGYVRARLFQAPPLLGILPRPPLDHGSVNPPVRIYVPAGDPAAAGS
jgi:hypothetical protein